MQFQLEKQTVYAGHLREEMARNTALATYEEENWGKCHVCADNDGIWQTRRIIMG